MIRGNLVTQVQHLIGRSDTNFVATIREFLNQSIREWARKRPWLGLKQRITLFGTGQRFLILPEFVQRPLQLFDVTNVTPLEARGNFDMEYPSALAAQQSGRAEVWQDMGVVPTVTDPTGTITVESSDASDTETIHVTGFAQVAAASGTPLELQAVQESIILNGTTRATSSNLFVQLTSIGKGGDTAGNISIRDGDSQTLLSHLGRFQESSEYIRLELIRVPSAGTKFELTAMVKPGELDNDSQSPHPSISSDFLIWNTAGLSLMAIGERQAGTLYMQKARSIVDDSDFRERGFGDQFLQIQPILDMTQAEEIQQDE